MFPRLLHAVASLAGEPRFELFVQRGSSGPQFAHLPGEDFISREVFEEHLAWADLVICHGGAGALYEAHLAGHIPIVLPRLARFGESVNDHQLELVSKLSATGKAILCEDPSRLLDLVLSAKPRAERMRVEPELIQAVRHELLSPSKPILRPGLIAKALSLYRRPRS